MSTMTPRAYRADIDGLRAVAIGLVVLFHATGRCPGGFVGVDVFFVISGFLITGLLLDEQRRGELRLIDFWTRRVRRLLPAAVIVACVTLVAGWFILFPDDYAHLAASVAAQQVLASNVYFSRQAGYFSNGALFKPLLHTWSLAVEEQFYIAYPVLLTLLDRLPRRVMVAALAVITAVSFAISDWGAQTRPFSTFYLLPMRAWEMLLGGLICFVPVPRRSGGLAAHVLAGLGAVGIVWSAFAFDRTTPFPGRAALVPCVATALVIYANSWTRTVVGRALELRPIVFVGLISYSLYLWHWPLLSCAAFLECSEAPDKFPRLVAVAVAAVLAVVSWRYVERPFRRKEILPRRRSLWIAAVAVVSLLLTASLAIVAGGGVPSRFDPRAVSYAGTKKRDIEAWPPASITVEDAEQGRLPVFGAPEGTATCLVWGDSHGRVLVPAVAAACKTRGMRCLQATRPRTPPTLGFSVGTTAGLNDRAVEFNRAVVDRALAEHVDIVIMCGYWSKHVRHANFERCLRDTIRELSAAGIRVVLVRDVAEIPEHVNPTLALATAVERGEDVRRLGVPPADHRRANEQCDAIFDRLADGDVTVLDPAPAFVDETGLWRLEYGGASMYADNNHLSVAGALRLQPCFEALLEALDDDLPGTRDDVVPR